MNKKLRTMATAVLSLAIPTLLTAQAPNLGVAADFVLFSSTGAVTNTGHTILTGNVGTNSGSSTGFGNVNGVMHDGGPVSAQCAADLLAAYNDLSGTVPTHFPAALLGNGQTLTAGVYSIGEAAVLNLELRLNAQNNPNAVFIFLIDGAFSTNALSRVTLLNGALACNVFWVTEGLVNMAAGTTMRGTIIANNAAIVMQTGDTLEGRAFSTAGAITVSGLVGRTPLGCGSPVLVGPAAPTLGAVTCFGIFSADGPVSNTGTTTIMGDVGANGGLTTGFDQQLVTGTIHPSPNLTTSQAASALQVAYGQLGALVADITLLYPAQFGQGLELTPHVYIMNGEVTFTDTVYLNAQNNANAVFVIKVYGAFAASALSKVKLINGAQAKNVYWMVNGAIDLGNQCDFSGTIISQGAINITTGAMIHGRILNGVGAVGTASIAGIADMIPSSCNPTVGIADAEDTDTQVVFHPNPFAGALTVRMPNASATNAVELTLYNALGKRVLSCSLNSISTSLDVHALDAGVYFYQITGSNSLIATGRVIAVD